MEKKVLPSHGIRRDEKTGENDHALTRVGGVLRVIDIQDEMSDGGKDHEEGEHAGTADDE